MVPVIIIFISASFFSFSVRFSSISRSLTFSALILTGLLSLSYLILVFIRASLSSSNFLFTLSARSCDIEKPDIVSIKSQIK